MSHSVTYTSDDQARNKIIIKISCIHSKKKFTIGLKHIYRIIRSESESE